MAILHGRETEDAVHAGFLAEDPPFVLTGAWCDGEDWTSCALLREPYEKIGEKGDALGAPEYHLWRKR